LEEGVEVTVPTVDRRDVTILGTPAELEEWRLGGSGAEASGDG
jgi:hypothetical protein